MNPNQNGVCRSLSPMVATLATEFDFCSRFFEMELRLIFFCFVIVQFFFFEKLKIKIFIFLSTAATLCQSFYCIGVFSVDDCNSTFLNNEFHNCDYFPPAATRYFASFFVVDDFKNRKSSSIAIANTSTPPKLAFKQRMFCISFFLILQCWKTCFVATR